MKEPRLEGAESSASRGARQQKEAAQQLSSPGETRRPRSTGAWARCLHVLYLLQPHKFPPSCVCICRCCSQIPGAFWREHSLG